MKVKIENILIDNQAILPTLTIGVDLEFRHNIEAPVSISGRLITADGKTISFLNEYQVNFDKNFGFRILARMEKDKINQEKKANNYYAKMTAMLSPKAIEHIELQREINNEKSVMFSMDFVIKFIDIPAESQNLTDDSLMQLRIKREYGSYEIKQSDWIKNFSPQLGIGNFLLLELQIPDNHKVKPDWVELYNRLVLRLNEMKNAIRQGDWQKTMDRSRQFFDALKIGDGKDGHKKFEEELRKLFIKDQHSNEGIQNFLDGIHKFFDYNSKFVHDTDRKGNLNPIPLANKEDAYFIYILGIGLLNIIGRKTNDDQSEKMPAANKGYM